MTTRITDRHREKAAYWLGRARDELDRRLPPSPPEAEQPEHREQRNTSGTNTPPLTCDVPHVPQVPLLRTFEREATT